MKVINPVPKISLPEYMVTQIKALILKDQLLPGEPLLTESELCEQFEVGRSTVREAKRALSLMGLIYSSPRKGTFITENAKNLLAFQDALDLKAFPILEVFQARKVLEGELAALAALNALPEDVANIESIIQEMKIAEAIKEVYIDLDLEFHLAVAACAKNDVLLQMYRGIQEMLKKTITAANKVPGVQVKSHGYHEQTLDAIIKREPSRAKQITLTHLEEIELIIRGHLS